MVYGPEYHALVCPQCGNTSEKMPAGAVSDGKTCAACGAPLQNTENRLVFQCTYCRSWMTIDPNLQDQNAPKKIRPFAFGRKAAREKILDAFDHIPFMPKSFLAEADGEEIEAIYAPFWTYDVSAEGRYEYDAEEQRSYTAGDTTHTDHDVYHLYRGVEASFDNVPVDAMESLQDPTIDASVAYRPDDVTDFDPVYLAGTDAFLPEKPAEDEGYRRRAADWAVSSVLAKEDRLTNGYSEVRRTYADVHAHADETNAESTLLPVYRYLYKGFGDHKIYMDGTTGRMSGDAPCDRGRVLAHYLIEAACVLLSSAAVIGILGVLL